MPTIDFGIQLSHVYSFIMIGVKILSLHSTVVFVPVSRVVQEHIDLYHLTVYSTFHPHPHLHPHPRAHLLVCTPLVMLLHDSLY